MKKIIFILMTILIIFVSAGCTKYSYKIEVDENENITYSETQALNTEVLKKYGVYNAQDLKKQMNSVASSLRSEDYIVKEYNDGKYQGLTRSHRYKFGYFKSNQISPFFKFKGDSPITSESYFGGRKVYNISMVFDMNQDEDSADNYYDGTFLFDRTDAKRVSDSKKLELTLEESIKGSKPITNLADIKNDPDLLSTASISITIPGKVLKHNATKVINKKEYYWDLSVEEPTAVNLKYETRDNAVSGIIVSIFIMLIGLVFSIYKTKE